MKFYSVFIQFDNGMKNAADFFAGMYRHYGSKEEAENAKTCLEHDSPKCQFVVL